MARGSSGRKGERSPFTTAWTLLPVTAGLSAGIVVWALRWEAWQVSVIILTALLCGVGLVLTQVIIRWDGAGGDLADLRQELVDSLELVGRPDERTQPAAAAEQFGVATPSS